MSQETTGTMTLMEHLRELRKRVVYAVIGFVIAAGVGWAFHAQVFEWLMEPYRRAMQDNYPELEHYIAFRSLIEPFVVYIKTSMAAGLILAGPWMLLQAWLFIGPGLHESERKMALPFLGATLFFFFGGVAFCRYLVLEPTMSVLIDIGIDSANPTIMMQDYFSFTSTMLFVFGLLFELPVVITFLSILELVTAAFLLKQWRMAVVITFIVAAVLTPPDPLSQTMLAVPMVILYMASIGVVFLIERSRDRRRAQETASA